MPFVGRKCSGQQFEYFRIAQSVNLFRRPVLCHVASFSEPHPDTVHTSVHVCKYSFALVLPFGNRLGYAGELKAKVHISRRALILRIRRKLSALNQTLVSDFKGHYIRIDLARNAVLTADVNLLALAKELKC